MYSPLSGDHADPGGGVLPTKAHTRAPTRDPWPVQQQGLLGAAGQGALDRLRSYLLLVLCSLVRWLLCVCFMFIY